MEEMEEREAQPRAFQPRQVLISGLLLLPKLGGLLHQMVGTGWERHRTDTGSEIESKL
jgi:hypothetical protein